MSENNLPQTVNNDNEIVSKKQIAWGKFGVSLHHNELSLQAQSQQIVNGIVIPKKYEDITAAEEALKIAKQKHLTLINDRKKITDTIDGVKSRLMQPEKSIEEPIAKATAEIIKLKKEKEDTDRKARLKLDEAKLIKEKIVMYVADNDAALLQSHAKLISDSYKHALQSIAPENILPFIDKVKKRITIPTQTIPPPKFTAQHYSYHTKEEIELLVIENFKPKPPQEYVDGFSADVDRKYFDYQLAWNNKSQAAELDEKEFEETKIAIEKEKNSNIVAAKFQTISSPAQVEDGKQLKRLYKINMDETFYNAYLINTAYLSNIELCEPNLRIKNENAFNLGIKQMIAALEKVKNDDNNFNFTNIVFQEVVKL